MPMEGTFWPALAMAGLWKAHVQVWAKAHFQHTLKMAFWAWHCSEAGGYLINTPHNGTCQGQIARFRWAIGSTLWTKLEVLAQRKPS